MEFLLSIGLLVLLGVLGMAVTKSVSRKGELLKEVSAGRGLMTAYQAYAIDHGGRVMVGQYLSGEYPQPDADPTGYAEFKVKLPTGEVLDDVSSAHYTYRLAAYLGFKIEGALLTGANLRVAEQIKRVRAGMPHYGLSMYPSFGINDYYTRRYLAPDNASERDVGYEAERVQRLNQVEEPGRFLVFASAKYEGEVLTSMGIPGGRLEGFHRITPPQYRTKLWPTENQLDARHDGKVLCVFLDGSVRTHTEEELEDMRYWSYRAQQEDDPNYQVATQGSGGIGGGGGGRR